MNIDTLMPLYNIEAVRKIEYYSETDSTNQRAKEDIRNIENNEESENGSLELPCLYIADIQTAGRGRMGRPWKSDSGEGIWMSYSFRPKLAPDKIPGITLLASIAVARGISEYIKNNEPSFNVG
jgi:BirA family biotin operon repressor/biotin-[acetyl-CoA-carboxylase] ligase